MNRNHFVNLQNLYVKAPIQQLYPQTNINISEKQAIINMPVNQSHKHAANAVHGSVYFRMLDDAAFFAANSIEEKYFVLTASFKVTLLKPVTEGILTSKGVITESIGKKIYANATLTNDKEEVVANGEGLFLRSNIELTSLYNKA